ncbi:centromere protein T isoform X2 [Strigops habroptila]|uniref:centromere protein T isoform X2 n=1 Tax=Strigops habroptila TaxID=2489341 RepID=UPI0011CFA96E|nr:centromere protein T isoform X2 [Strigops habroptila]
MSVRRATTGAGAVPARRSSARRATTGAGAVPARRSSARPATTGAGAVPARRSSARRATTGAAAVPARRSTTGAAAMPARRSTTGAVSLSDRRLRVRRSTTGAAAEAKSDPENRNLGRTSVRLRRLVFPDLIDDTPRTLIKKIIRIFPPASPVVPEISKHEEPETAAGEAQAELPTGRLSKMEEVQLSDFIPEERAVFTFRMSKEREKLSISEFERAVSKQLLQNQALSTLDSTMAGMSPGSLVQPDTVERRGLLRRPKNHKHVDIKAFEDEVEQYMLRRKAQSYLVDSEMSSGIQTTMLTSVGTDKRKTQVYSQDLILDCEHVDSMTSVSSKPPVSANPPEDKQDHSQRTNPVEQLSVSEEVAVGKGTPAEEEGIAEGGVEYQGSPKAEREIAQGIGGGSLSKHSNPTFSENSGMEPLKEAVEQADELEDQPILVELYNLEEKPSEIEAEDAENEEDFMKTLTFVYAAAYEPPLLTPSPAKPAAPDLPQRPPLQPQRAKAVPKCSQRKPSEPKIPSSLIKSVFKHYAKMPVASKSFKIVEKCTEKYFKQLCNDLAAFASHAGRKTVEVSDVEVLMRRFHILPVLVRILLGVGKGWQ